MCGYVCHVVCEVRTLVTLLLSLTLSLSAPRKGISVKLLNNCRWNIKVVSFNSITAHYVINIM